MRWVIHVGFLFSNRHPIVLWYRSISSSVERKWAKRRAPQSEGKGTRSSMKPWFSAYLYTFYRYQTIFLSVADLFFSMLYPNPNILMKKHFICIFHPDNPTSHHGRRQSWGGGEGLLPRTCYCRLHFHWKGVVTLESNVGFSAQTYCHVACFEKVK